MKRRTKIVKIISISYLFSQRYIFFKKVIPKIIGSPNKTIIIKIVIRLSNKVGWGFCKYLMIFSNIRFQPKSSCQRMIIIKNHIIGFPLVPCISLPLLSYELVSEKKITQTSAKPKIIPKNSFIEVFLSLFAFVFVFFFHSNNHNGWQEVWQLQQVYIPKLINELK